MGIYTKHIFRIDDPHTVDDLIRLSEEILKVSDYKFNVYPELDCVDDRTWNFYYGAKLYDLNYIMMEVSEKMKDMHISVYCHCETGHQYIVNCYNGYVDTTDYTEYDTKNNNYIKVCEFDDIDYDWSLGKDPIPVKEIHIQ